MVIQDIIRQALLSNGVAAPALKEMPSDNTAKETVVTAKGSVISPIKNCEFVAMLLVDNEPVSDNCKMFLKKFNIPEAGIKFDSSEDSMWFPIPAVNMPEFTFDSYIMNSLRGVLWNLYYNQFSHGLLSTTPPNIKIVIGILTYNEKPDIETDRISIYEAADNKVDKAIGRVLGRKEKEPAQVEEEDTNPFSMFKPLLGLNYCSFSKPTISQDSASNEFSTCSMSCVYRSFEDYTNYLL